METLLTGSRLLMFRLIALHVENEAGDMCGVAMETGMYGMTAPTAAAVFSGHLRCLLRHSPLLRPRLSGLNSDCQLTLDNDCRLSQ